MRACAAVAALAFFCCGRPTVCESHAAWDDVCNRITAAMRQKCGPEETVDCDALLTSCQGDKSRRICTGEPELCVRHIWEAKDCDAARLVECPMTCFAP